jgi:shikimate O-hydroxycinnamoyltransferase
VCISHRIADGASAATFLGAWSDTSRGVAAAVEAVCPNFDAAAMYFPPKEISWGKGDLVVTKDKIVTRRLVFDKSSIAALKDKAFSIPKLPTRVEPVSAFIWKRLMAISKSKPAPVRVHVAIHVVNLRERTVPPMPMHSIGNLVYSAVILSTHDDHDSHGILVNKLSNAIRGINGDYVKKLHRGMILDSLTKGVKLSSEGGMEIYKFSAWCRFPLYETDFGWGEPTSWVCLPAVPIKNQVYLLSTRDGHGIEAFVNILEEDAPVFDGDPELLPFMSCKIGD